MSPSCEHALVRLITHRTNLDLVPLPMCGPTKVLQAEFTHDNTHSVFSLVCTRARQHYCKALGGNCCNHTFGLHVKTQSWLLSCCILHIACVLLHQGVMCACSKTTSDDIKTTKRRVYTLHNPPWCAFACVCFPKPVRGCALSSGCPSETCTTTLLFHTVHPHDAGVAAPRYGAAASSAPRHQSDWKVLHARAAHAAALAYDDGGGVPRPGLQ